MIGVLIECSIRAVALAAGVGAVLAVLRVRQAAARHAVWTGVLAAMLLLPAASLWVPKAVVRALPADFELPIPETVIVRQVDKLPGPVAAPVMQTPAWSWSQAAIAVYLLGVSLMFSRLTSGLIRTRRLFRSASGLYTPYCVAPVTVGVLHPRVFLPESYRDWTPEKLKVVLTHEQQHVRRRDPLIRLLSLLNRCVFWFHPLAWWLERHLAALAEETCDAAVLANGHQAGDYAEYLLEMARAVERKGLRVDVHGSAMDGGALSRRIPRILTGGFAPAISRSRLAMVGTLCGAVIVAVVACKFDRAQERAPGQPTMNELMHRRAAESRAREDKYLAFRNEALGMTATQVKDLEAKLTADPADETTHEKLLLYYDSKSDFKSRSRLALWPIEHAPESRLAAFTWYLDPAQDRDGYELGKQLWLAHLKRPGASVNVRIKVAAFLSMADQPRAEEILLAGLKEYPQDQRWRYHLASLYYQTLRDEAQGSYAQSVRQKLDRSQDPDLLAQVGEMLEVRRSQHDPDTFALGKSYLDRAVALQPSRPRAIWVRVIEASRKPNPSGEDRLVTKFHDLHALYLQDIGNAEMHAHDLLNLAAAYPNDPISGDAIFEAKMTLGKIALRRRDKKTAAKYLLDAANTTQLNWYKYNRLPMELPRALVDWGEREAVAQFLERCAKVNNHGKELTGWAAQIRRGINPELTPMMTGCAIEPC